jgi:xylulokinase
MSFLLGFDIGSSSIKASLIESETGKLVASATSPSDTELEIHAPQPGWAEQDPNTWWDNVKNAAANVRGKAQVNLHDVKAIGISYQMHGLVIVDKNHQVLRPSIIWCDSRAVPIGEKAFAALGPQLCLKHLLNSPGNFTASKLRWILENEPETYKKIHKAMLPGDYIAMVMTGDIRTTPSGLSEGILWDFVEQEPASMVLDYYGIDRGLLPEVSPTFSIQGNLTSQAAEELGLKPGIPVAYRAGDQPNNAFSLGVLNPGELAATAGTSGVVYGVGEEANYDSESRVNTFVHVNHTPEANRYGILLCLNGTGILNRWLKYNFAGNGPGTLSYEEMNSLAQSVPVGAQGLTILPYGNGAERTLENRNIGAHIDGLDLNLHQRSHVLRAGQEGIVFALNYGLEIMKSMGMEINSVKAGYANMFLSPLFAEAFSTITGARVELYNTDGAQGAARGAGIGAGIYGTNSDAFRGLTTIRTIEPNTLLKDAYSEAYAHWVMVLNRILEG